MEKRQRYLAPGVRDTDTIRKAWNAGFWISREEERALNKHGIPAASPRKQARRLVRK